MLIGVGMFAAVYGLGTLLSNAYCYFFLRRETFEQFLYNALPELKKMTDQELNDLERIIGKDPRKPDKYKWMW